MPNRTHIIEGEHPELGRVWAAWDASARYVTPQVCRFRFSAQLAPYSSEEAARAALRDAGALIEGEG